MRALPPEFYDRPVLEVARDLVGCTVEHRGVAGVVVETEAYHDSEPACHAFVGLTPRTRTLFGPPGRAYVYRSYGIHAMLNAVCEPEGVGAAVLIRALDPTIDGRRAGCAASGAGGRRPTDRRSLSDRDLCSGPGKLTQALGISLEVNGSDLSRGPVRIGPRTAAGWSRRSSRTRAWGSPRRWICAGASARRAIAMSRGRVPRRVSSAAGAHATRGRGVAGAAPAPASRGWAWVRWELHARAWPGWGSRRRVRESHRRRQSRHRRQSAWREPRWPSPSRACAWRCPTACRRLPSWRCARFRAAARTRPWMRRCVRRVLFRSAAPRS